MASEVSGIAAAGHFLTSAFRIPFFNSAFDNMRKADVLDFVERTAGTGSYGYMASVNIDMLVKADRDPSFQEALNNASLLLIDSVPLSRLGKIAGIPIKEKLSGSDLMSDICDFAALKGYSVFLLGGKPGVPELAADMLKRRYPALQVAGTMSPDFGFENEVSSIAEVVTSIRDSKADLLFVCLGAPKSEMLCHLLLDLSGVSFAFCVGAAIDFEAGSVKRAPYWVREAGLEWLYRFAKEPRRLFRRYFVDSWRFAPLAFSSMVGNASRD